MGASYTRQSSYTTGDTIQAADTNDEFDQLLAAFNATSGHTHDGTSGEGGPITGLISNTLTFGAGSAGTDITITFDGETNDGVMKWMEDEDYFEFSDDVLIASTEKLQFRDTAIYINSSTDGQLDFIADGAVLIDTGGDITLDADGGDVFLKDGGTQYGALTNTSGNLIIKSGSTTAMTFSGANVTFAGTVTIGSAGISEAELEILDGASVTTTELNIIDGDTSATSTTVADADRVVMNDGGTMVQVAVTDLAAYFDDEITAMPNLVTTAATTVGALASGSIASGFGNIDNGASNITSGGLLKLDVDADADDLTGDSATGRLTIGAGEDLNLYHGGTNSYIVNDTGDLIIDTAGDVVLDANGADVLLKDDGTQYAALTNSSGNLIIKSGSTTALTFSGANVTIAGDLTISGDDLTMGTNTSGMLLIADGTNFNPTAVSGDISIDNSGAVAIASGVIVNADINSSAAIADSKLATISTADKVSGAAIQVDGATDGTSITLADADKFLVDDGGTTKYITASQINSYASAAVAADDIGTGDGAVTIATSSGNITIDAQAGDADIIFKGTDSSSDITALTLDMSEAGAATFNNKVVATELDISGNMDIDGTSNLDAVDIDGAVQIDATVTVGVDDTGYDVKFFGATSGQYMLWDESADELVLAGDSKLSFNDAAGGENIIASSDGHLEINAGTTLDITAPTVDINASTKVDISGDLLVSGEVQTASIGYTDGDNSITIADGGGITAAAGITSTAAANTLGATSFNDADITNVGDIAIDSISADGTDINVAVSDNSATALTIKQGSDAYLIIDTANSSESVSIGTGISGTAITIGHGTSETTVADNLTVSGNATVTGNFTVNGTTTTVDTTNLTVTDPLVKYGQGYTGTAYDQGFLVTRGDGSSSNTANRGFIWDESADEFATINANTEAGTTAGNVTINDYADLHTGAITADDTITFGGLVGSAGGATVTGVLDEDNLSSASDTKLATQQSIKAYVDSEITGSGSMSNWVLEDDDGTEVTVSNAKEVKFIGSGITTNWTDTDNDTDADPYDMTFSIDAAQTRITSLLATDIKIGEDDQTKIDFETADTINFYAGNEKQLVLTDGALTPGTNAIVDLGTDSLEFKDAYFDGTVEADAITIGGTSLADVITGTTVTNATNAGHVSVADNESTNEDNLIPFIEDTSATGNVGLESDGDFTYNPSTGRLTATQLAGTLQTAAQANITSLGTLTALTVDDVAVNGKVITMTGSSSDTAVFTVGTNGTLSIVTTDNAAAAANIQITADGTAELAGTTVTLDSAGDIELEATNDINIPANVGLTFGDDAEKIEGNGTDLTISGNNINLTASADVVIPANVGITFGTGEKIEGDNTDLTITSGAKINLTATSDVVIPANVGITFGTGEKIEGDNTDLTVSSGADINLTATADVNIPANVGITFGDDGEKIEGDGTNLTVASSNNLTLDADNNITIDANGGTITFSDNGSSLGTITSSGYSGNAATATVATTVTITDNESTDEDNAIIFTAGGDVDGGNIGLESDGNLTYNPSTGRLTATQLSGTLQTAAQANITSLGTLTTLAVDNITIDGSEIDNSSGNLVLDSAQDIHLDSGHGDIHLLDAGSLFLNLYESTDDAYLYSTRSNAHMKFQGNDGGSPVIALDLDMENAGAATFNNNVTAYSDARLKSDIKTIEGGLEKVLQLRGVTYIRDDNKDGGQQIGVIAQEVEEIIPQVVKTADDEMGTKSVDYGRITAVLIESIKELKAEIDELKEKLNG